MPSLKAFLEVWCGAPQVLHSGGFGRAFCGKSSLCSRQPSCGAVVLQNYAGLAESQSELGAQNMRLHTCLPTFTSYEHRDGL